MSEETHPVERVFNLLLHAFGPQGWWPADTPFEMAVGAVLTQHTAWGNVEKALVRLKANGSFSVEGLLAMPEGDLAECIRPAGIYRVKARRLRALLRFLADRCAGDVAQLGRIAGLREALLTVEGIGPETADCIMLYAAGQPSFVVDAYTRRIFARLGLIDGGMGYEDIRAFFMAHLPKDAALYGEYHALIVVLGKAFCRPKPLCSACPLREMCGYATERT